MTEVRVEHLNAVWARVHCEDSVAMELSDRFSFEAPGHKYHPAYKAGHWDGRTRLFNLRNRTIYRGLEPAIAEYCREQEYEFTPGPREMNRFLEKNSERHLREFVEGLGLPGDRELRDYQLGALRVATKRSRALYHSPVNSGKSLIMYTIYRWHDVRTLLIVPRSDLVEQMHDDFKSYGCDMSRFYKTSSGADRNKMSIVALTLENGTTINLPGSKSVKLVNKRMVRADELTEGDDVDENWLRNNFSKKQVHRVVSGADGERASEEA